MDIVHMVIMVLGVAHKGQIRCLQHYKLKNAPSSPTTPLTSSSVPLTY